jgi:hypothetical protein
VYPPPPPPPPAAAAAAAEAANAVLQQQQHQHQHQHLSISLVMTHKTAVQLTLKGVTQSHTWLEKMPFFKFNNHPIWILLSKGSSFVFLFLNDNMP